MFLSEFKTKKFQFSIWLCVYRSLISLFMSAELKTRQKVVLLLLTTCFLLVTHPSVVILISLLYIFGPMRPMDFIHTTLVNITLQFFICYDYDLWASISLIGPIHISFPLFISSTCSITLAILFLPVTYPWPTFQFCLCHIHYSSRNMTRHNPGIQYISNSSTKSDWIRRGGPTSCRWRKTIL